MRSTYKGQTPSYLPPFWRFQEALTIVSMVPWYIQHVRHIRYSPDCSGRASLRYSTSMLEGFCAHCGELWES